MADLFHERHQDYVMDLSAQLGTLAANTQYPGMQLLLDPDAPFIMRSLAARMRWDLSTGQQHLSQLWFRLKRASTIFTSSDWLPLNQLALAFGQGGNPYPIWPHIPYPERAAIELDVWNRGANTLPGVQVVFRGVKRFQGSLSNPWPAKTRLQNWTRSVKISGIGYTGSTAHVRRFLLMPVTDADFVLRHLQGGCVYNPNFPSAFFPARNVWVTLRDDKDKPYSNAPVDINILMGQGTMALASVAPNSSQYGPFHPGLLYPEIYIPRYCAYSMDVLREDVAYFGQEGLGDVRMDFALGGVKVFAL